MERTTRRGWAEAWQRVWVGIVLVVIVIVSCGAGRIKVTGKVETYDWLRFEDLQLRYNYSTGEKGAVLQGTAPLAANGEFSFYVGQDILRSGYFSIDGFYQHPPLSVIGGSRTRLPKDSTDQIDLGTVYIYNFIQILDDFPTPLTLPELSLQWDSDVPAVDSYCVEILSYTSKGLAAVVTVCGVKSRDFSFSDVESVLGKVGTYDVRGLRVSVTETGLHGAHEIVVKALRTVAGSDIPIATSSLKELTISDR